MNIRNDQAAEQPGGGEIDRDLDIAGGGPRIGTDLMGCLQQAMRQIKLVAPAGFEPATKGL
jgi:hypothetical protein